MSFIAVIRFQNGRRVEKKADTWADINGWVRSLGAAKFPLFTTLIVTKGQISERYSVRGGGDEALRLVRLTTRINPVSIPGGKASSGPAVPSIDAG